MSSLVHFLWFKFGKAQPYCSQGEHFQVSWDKRDVDCPRCLEHLDSL